MGLVAGWDEIMDGTVLRGTGHSPHLSSSDGDWLLDVNPAPGYEYLLSNPEGAKNANGFVECEVEPPDNLPGGKNAENENVVNEFIGALDRRPVKVVGTWVTDNAHDAKTEIHPVTSLLAKLPPPNPMTRRFVFFVFSDTSGGMPPTPAHPTWIFPPHVGEDRTGNFQIAVPAGSTLAKIREDGSMAGSVSLGGSAGPGFSYVTGEVTSGKPDEGKGFYHLIFDVPALFSLRAYFESEAFRATAPLKVPPECNPIVGELHALQKEYNELVALELKDHHKPLDSPEVRQLLEQIKKKTQQLHACMRRSLSVRAALTAAGQPTLRKLIESAYP